MSSSSSAFSSVKLPAHLVRQAREAAQPQRRSVAGQIEYWATLGRIADETGLTVQEAREAIARYDARQRGGPLDESLDAIEARFVDAEASGRLVQVLPQCFTPDADIYAVYPQRHQLAARVRAFVDFVALSFAQRPGGPA